MRQPRWKFTTRGLMLAMVLIGFNLAGARATWSCYPLPPTPHPIGYGGRGGYIQYRADGSVEEGIHNLETGYRRVVAVWPSPHPGLLRIWSPFLTTLAITLLILGGWLSGMPLPRLTTRRLAIVAPIAALAIWLMLPLVEIVGNPRGDSHVHSDSRSVHRNPFWPRYSRLLMGRPWPDDYICPDYHAWRSAP